MMKHTSTLKQLRLKEILGVRKKISQGVGVPGLPCENNVVARYQEIFLPPPPLRRRFHKGEQGAVDDTFAPSQLVPFP